MRLASFLSLPISFAAICDKLGMSVIAAQSSSLAPCNAAHTLLFA